MIKSVIGNSPYLTVATNNASNFMNNYSGAQGLGNIRFNTTNQGLEVYDGTMWHPIQMGTVSLSLTPDAVAAIAWASQQRHDEMKIKELAERHPAVADQLAAVQEAEEKLRMLTLLVQT